MASEAAILLKDVEGEKFGLLRPKLKQVYRGELLLSIPRDKVIPRKDGKSGHNFYCASDPAVTLYCSEQDIAPLSDYDFGLMEAIKSREDRFDVIVNDILEWGSELKVGEFVKALLPPKTPMSLQPAVSRVEYIGRLPNECGVQFGVQIMDPQYRGHGCGNGFFGGQQFFTCEEYCAMFVSLDRLKPMEYKQESQSSRDNRKHQRVTQQVDSQRMHSSERHQSYSPTPHHSQFKLGDRVLVHNKKGIGIHGSVRWIERVKYGHEVLLAVGIETDIPVQSKDFEGSLSGLHLHFKCHDSRHGKVVMPEPLVAFEHLDTAKRAKQKNVASKAIQNSSVDSRVPEEDILVRRVKEQSEDEYIKGALNTQVIDREEQIRALNEFEKMKEEMRQKLMLDIKRRGQEDHYEAIPGLPGQPSNQRTHPPSSSGQLGASENDRKVPEQSEDEYIKGAVNTFEKPQEERKQKLMQALHGSQEQNPIKQNLYPGSRVQIPTQSPTEPFKYGVIRWLDEIPQIQCMVAGIELDDYMDGCTDGTLKSTGQKLFSCPPGKGIYYPVESLQSDEGSWEYYFRQWQESNAYQKQLENKNMQLESEKKVLTSDNKDLELSQTHLEHENTQLKQEILCLQQQLATTSKENTSLLSAQQESIAFGLEPWKVKRDDVILGRMIAGGGWGVIHQAKLQVAVKQFYPNILSERNLARLQREMRMLALVRHPNLLQFIAAVFDENDKHEQNPPYIITELLDMSLRTAYEKNLLPRSSLQSIFTDTARALDYLHRRHEAIIHRDVSSANVLLKRHPNNKWVAKLSDLGSANLAKEAYTMNEGARVYLAPEAFTLSTDSRSSGTLTPSVDVYSYGIVLCEVATSTFPEQSVLPTLLVRVQKEWYQLYQLVVACTKPDPTQRPSMAGVLTSLEQFPNQ